MAEIKINPPLSEKDVAALKAGDRLLISGCIYTARDTAHKRMIELLEKGEKLPFDLEGQIIYYVGPTPARPGRATGSAGPTTSGRMDRYAPELMKLGLRGMIGKGARSDEVKEAMRVYGSIYMAAAGGAGALLSQRIVSSTVIAWEDLGAEAVRKLEVLDFPVTVINDIHGGDLYRDNVEKYRIE